MTQAVRLRNFCFWLVCERHFAKEFGDLEWQEMPGIQFALVEGLCTFFLFSFTKDCSDKLWMDGRGPCVLLLSCLLVCWILVVCLP